MRKALLTTLLIISTIPALAQSALGIGLHEAENNVDITYTGTGWTTVVDGGISYVQSDTAGDVMSFEFTGGALLVYRNMDSSAPDVEMCLDDVCSTISNTSSVAQYRVPVGFVASAPGTHTFTIELLSSSTFQVDNLLVLASESGGTTVIDFQYPAPEDTVSFDVSGQPSSFSYSMSAGDVMTNVLLVALIVLSISQLLVGMLWKN